MIMLYYSYLEKLDENFNFATCKSRTSWIFRELLDEDGHKYTTFHLNQGQDLPAMDNFEDETQRKNLSDNFVTLCGGALDTMLRILLAV